MYAVPVQTMTLSQSDDFKKTVLEKMGDLSGLKLAGRSVLIATYIRPEKTSGGIYRPNVSVQEDIYQGKVGLVLTKSDAAFSDEDANYGFNVEIGDYVVYRPSDAWEMTIRGVHCRVVYDDRIRAKIDDPELVF